MNVAVVVRRIKNALPTLMVTGFYRGFGVLTFFYRTRPTWSNRISKKKIHSTNCRGKKPTVDREYRRKHKFYPYINAYLADFPPTAVARPWCEVRPVFSALLTQYFVFLRLKYFFTRGKMHYKNKKKQLSLAKRIVLCYGMTLLITHTES